MKLSEIPITDTISAHIWKDLCLAELSNKPYSYWLECQDDYRPIYSWADLRNFKERYGVELQYNWNFEEFKKDIVGYITKHPYLREQNAGIDLPARTASDSWLTRIEIQTVDGEYEDILIDITTD